MTQLLIPLFESKHYAFNRFFYQGLGVVLIPLTFTQNVDEMYIFLTSIIGQIYPLVCKISNPRDL